MMRNFTFVMLLLLPALSVAQTPWLHVDGNKIKDPEGNEVILRGVAVQDIFQMTYENTDLFEVFNMITDKEDDAANSPGWYPKVVRLTVEPEINDLEGYYEDILKPAVDSLTKKDVYVIVDYHHIADIEPNIENTTEFWDFMAPKFRDYSNVLYEIYNEPINQGWDWDDFKPYMQDWVDLVRKHAPHNLILAGSPSWSQRMGGAADNPLSGGNIVYVAHIYPQHFKSSWNLELVERCAEQHPVFMSEWGFREELDELLSGTADGYGHDIVEWMDELGLSWTAWCADNDWEPAMFTRSWELRTGNNNMGGFVKDTLYEKRNDHQPADIECSAPFLGYSQTLCGNDNLTLSGGVEDIGQTFTWILDGDTLTSEVSEEISPVSEAGIYKLVVEYNGCKMSDSVEISDQLFPPDLGPDQALFTDEDSVELVAAPADSPYTFEWYKDGELISGADSASIKVSDTCTTVFEVRMSHEGCGEVTDDFEILCRRGLYLGERIDIPSKVEAEHYDESPLNGVAFWDSDNANNGGELRNDPVDVESSQDEGGGYDIGYTEDEEWLEYSINVTDPGEYYMLFRIASDDEEGDGGSLRVIIDGEDRTGSVAIPNTGDWQAWDDVIVGGVSLTETDSTLRVFIEEGGFNLNYLDFSAEPFAATLDAETFKEAALYPNPTTGIINIRGKEEEYNWELYSASGAQLKTGTGKSADISSLEPGVYILMVDGVAYRVVKQ